MNYKVFENNEIKKRYYANEIKNPTDIYEIFGNNIKVNIVPKTEDPRLTVIYNIEDIENPTMMYSWSENTFPNSGLTMFDKIEIDNVEMNITDIDNNMGKYQFDTVGRHVVKYTLKNPEIVGITSTDPTLTGNDIFFYNRGLDTITLGATFFTTNYIFGGDGNINNGIVEIIIPNSVKTIGMGFVFGLVPLNSVTIPNTVTEIKRESFGYSGITSITIPDSVISIGKDAFEGCNLSNVIIGNNVTTIGEHAFGGCTSLTSVTIGNNVTTIGDSAFYGCSNLTSINIPESVTNIDESAFGNCTSLISIIVEATTPPTLSYGGAFDNNAPDRKIYVPAESVDTYKAASGWSDYAADIEPIPIG